MLVCGGAGGKTDATAPAWKAPDGLPAHFLKATAEESVAEVFKAYTGARDAIAKHGAAPKDAAGYELKFSEKAAPILNLQADDKVLPILQGAMHKHGITTNQAGFVSDLVDGLIDAGIVQAPQKPEDIWKSLAGDFKGDDAAKTAEGQRLMADAQAFIDARVKSGAWTEEMKADAVLLTGSPHGLKILRELQAAGTTKSVVPGGGGGQGGVTADQLNSRTADPRNTYGNPQYDPAFAKETQRLYKQTYGE